MTSTKPVVHLLPGRESADGKEWVITSGITICCQQHVSGLTGDQGTIYPDEATCPKASA